VLLSAKSDGSPESISKPVLPAGIPEHLRKPAALTM
jgi:hypothetical protein